MTSAVPAQQPPRAGRARATEIGQSLVAALTWCSVALLFLVSAQRLHAWGIPYDTAGGSPLVKIHPGSWLALLAVGVAACLSGDPLRYFGRAADRWRGLAALFVLCLAVVAFTIVFEKQPFTPLVDSFMLPMALFILFAQESYLTERRLALLIHALLAANATLGIVEYVTGWRLTPFWAGDLLQVGDWRSTAFVGHPLANASITGAYILTLVLGGGRDLPAFIRPPAIVLQLVAMIAFGGRAATGAVVLLLAGLALWRSFLILRGRRFSLHYAAAACFAGPLLFGLFLLAWSHGFFDRFLERFVNDKGSAEARVVMFRVYDAFPLTQILFGPDHSWLKSLQYQEGINYGIESFWLSFILDRGLLLSLPFFVALGAFSIDIVRATCARAWLLLAFFYIVASASVSLTAKTSALGLFVIVVMVLLRPEADRDARRAPGRLARPC